MRRAQPPLPVHWVLLICFAVSGPVNPSYRWPSLLLWWYIRSRDCGWLYECVAHIHRSALRHTYNFWPTLQSLLLNAERSWFNSVSNTHITYLLLKKMTLTIKAHNSGVISQELQKAAEVLKDLSQDTLASESRRTGFLLISFLLMLRVRALPQATLRQSDLMCYTGSTILPLELTWLLQTTVTGLLRNTWRSRAFSLEPAQACPTTTCAWGFLPSARGGCILWRSELHF